jgi:hypothetical protein
MWDYDLKGKFLVIVFGCRHGFGGTRIYRTQVVLIPEFEAARK